MRMHNVRSYASIRGIDLVLTVCASRGCSNMLDIEVKSHKGLAMEKTVLARESAERIGRADLRSYPRAPSLCLSTRRSIWVILLLQVKYRGNLSATDPSRPVALLT
jgi:hypothetical protein